MNSTNCGVHQNVVIFILLLCPSSYIQPFSSTCQIPMISVPPTLQDIKPHIDMEEESLRLYILTFNWLEQYICLVYDRFSVNLACGSTPMSDVAFHLNPRFDQNHVVRNSRLGGRWGHEECTASQRNPFKRGAKFCLIILAVEDGFMVRHFVGSCLWNSNVQWYIYWKQLYLFSRNDCLSNVKFISSVTWPCVRWIIFRIERIIMPYWCQELLTQWLSITSQKLGSLARLLWDPENLHWTVLNKAVTVCA